MVTLKTTQERLMELAEQLGRLASRLDETNRGRLIAEKEVIAESLHDNFFRGRHIAIDDIEEEFSKQMLKGLLPLLEKFRTLIRNPNAQLDQIFEDLVADAPMKLSAQEKE